MSERRGSHENTGNPGSGVSRPSVELRDRRPSIDDGRRRPSAEAKRGTSLDIARQFEETKQRISFAQEKAKSTTKKHEGEKELDDLKKEVHIDDHTISLEELFARHASDLEKGLTSEDHARRLERFGRNELTPPKQIPWWIKLGEQMLNPFSLMLQAGSALCWIAYALDTAHPDYLYLGVVLYIVVVLTSLFSFFQEAKSESLMDGFKSMVTTLTKVRRDGMIKEIDARTLVVGDIVELQAGNRCPADIRVLKASNFKVDNSALTGEAEPQSRTPECTDENPLETKNLAFLGTLVVEGSVVGMVILTGDRTVMGRIAGLAAGTAAEETPLHREIHHFVKMITGVAITLGIIFFVFGGVKGTPVVTNLIFAIGIIVANVPEGLLATVTVALALTAARMAQKSVLVKNLESVETLGSTTTICSDKTGTLTQNRMTVVHVLYDEQYFTCSSTGNIADAQYDRSTDGFKALYRVGTLCSRSIFDPSPDNLALPILQRRVMGDASEAAILKFCELENPTDPFRDSYPKLAEIPFNSTNKFQVSIHALPDKNDTRRLLVMKGATERILDSCSTVLHQGDVVPMTPERRAKLDKVLLDLGGLGERILAFAHLFLDGTKFPADFVYNIDKPNFPLDGLTFVGFMGLLDPPKEAVPHAVAVCKEAGIRVIMVTGDHPVTAAAIARQVGIITEDTVDDIALREGVPVAEVDPKRAKAIVIHGQQIKEFVQDDWTRVLDHQQVVFARTSPQQKLLIVEACQKRGEIVAVTGDGVNDSPALKKADIGVAMGISGSDVSKDAADMILLDDNFASIVNGIEEGRIIFDNLRKTITYILRSNIPELIPFICYITINVPLPMSTVLILCVDLGTDMLPAVALAYEKAESDIMKRPPRDAKKDRLVDRRLLCFSYGQIGMIQAFCSMFVYFVVYFDYGLSPSNLFFLDENNEYMYKVLYCKWDDLEFPTYESALAAFATGVDSDGNLSGFDLPDDLPDDCKYFDHDEHFTKANFDAGLFEGFVPYATPEWQYLRLAQAQTAGFLSVVLCQITDAIVVKTRRTFSLENGLKNQVQNFAFFFEVGLACLIAYVPAINTVFATYYVLGLHWLPGLTYAISIFIYEEIRKYIVRRNPGGFIDVFCGW